ARVTRAQATQHAHAWLQRLGLTDHLDKRIGQLSGGQAQRVAIARAQVTQPVVTFADEPTGALDSRTSTEVLSELLNSTTGRGATLVLVTHDESVAARCSRVVRLADGAIISDSAQAPAQQAPAAHGQWAHADQVPPRPDHPAPTRFAAGPEHMSRGRPGPSDRRGTPPPPGNRLPLSIPRSPGDNRNPRRPARPRTQDDHLGQRTARPQRVLRLHHSL